MSFLEVAGEVNSISGEYQGGYSPISLGKGSLKLKIEDDTLVFSQLWKKYHELDVRNITNVLVKNEKEISKDVTLTRLLAFGIFAFGLKKKRKKESNYLIISTEEDGFENDFVMDIGKGVNLTVARGFVKTLKDTVTKYN